MATSIKFYIKITKRVKEKQSYPIYLRVVHNRQKSEGRISATLIPKCDIDHWSVDHRRPKENNKKSLITPIFVGMTTILAIVIFGRRFS